MLWHHNNKNKQITNNYLFIFIVTKAQNLFLLMIKSRRVRRAGLVTYTGESRNAYRVLVRDPEYKNRIEDLGLEGRIILIQILKK